MKIPCSALLLLVTACVVVAHPHPPPPRLLTAQEAVNGATYFARSRGLVVDQTYDVRLDPHGRWHVDLGGAGGRDRALVTLDGYSGRVIAARLSGAHGEWRPQPPAGTSPSQLPPTTAPPAPSPSAPPASPSETAPPGPPPTEMPPPPSGVPPPPPGNG